MSSQTLVLFDIDGTLLMAGDRAHATALLDAFREVFTLEPDLEGVSFAGMLDAQIVRQLLAKHPIDLEDAEQLIPEVMRIMGERYLAAMRGISLRDRLLPGVTRTVDELEAGRFPLGTLTGNARVVGQAKLHAAGIGSLARIGAYGDTAHERHQLVEIALKVARTRLGADILPAQTVLIGDTPQDIAAAKHAGARVLAVATGRYDLDRLAAHDPDELVPDLTNAGQVAEIVAKLTQQGSGRRERKAAQ